MTDRPIIFTAPEVRAFLDGRKNQFRVPPKYGAYVGEVLGLHQPGDRLWVREAGTWEVGTSAITGERTTFVQYRATSPENDPPFNGRWRSPIHMPRWASRLTLTVTDMRVQRLQKISESEEDAKAEGCMRGVLAGSLYSARDEFRDFWNTLHTKPGEDWDSNPWVAAYTCDVKRGNIDA